MRFIVLSFSLLFSTSFVFGQTVSDTVILGADYYKQCFYKLNDGTKNYRDLNDWDLAFEVQGINWGVWHNSAKGLKVHKLNDRNLSAWGTPADTTGYATWPTLENSAITWSEGSFNQNNDPGEPFDVGWGLYTGPPNHRVNGDSIYIISFPNGDIRQFTVTSLDDGVYIFRFSDLDGSNTVIDSVDKQNFSDAIFAYYNIGSQSSLNHEPANNSWELLFTTGLTPFEATPGLWFNPAGAVYSNSGINTAAAFDVITAQADYNSYSRNADTITRIGDTYRQRVNSVWEMNDSAAYFVEDWDDSIYKLVFTAFEGNTTGLIAFDKTLVFDPSQTTNTTAVESSLFDFAIISGNGLPNAQAVFRSDESKPLSVSIFDLTGKLHYSDNYNAEKGLNTYSLLHQRLAAGTYLVTMDDGRQQITLKWVTPGNGR